MQIMTAAILQASGGFGTFLVPLALMFGIMYLMVILPQQRQRKKTQAMLSALKTGDRKSTRLNSSHGYISYAVFCLKKKKNTHPPPTPHTPRPIPPHLDPP